MSSFKLFISRFRSSFLFQYKVIKSVADWTIMLYIIIPAAVIGTMIYRSWWMEIPLWAVDVPFELFFFLPFFFILPGYFRTYLLEADGVFLVKHREILTDLKHWGILSTYCSVLFLTLVIGVLLAPFWLEHFGFGIWTYSIYLLFVFASKSSHLAFKGILAGRRKNWKRTGLLVLAVIVQLRLWGMAYQFIANGQLLILVLLGILLLIISAVINRKRIYSKKSMAADLRIEGKLKVKWISLIFLFSYHVEKEPVSHERSRPWLFSKSQRILRRRTPLFGFLDFFLKVLIRNFTYSATYLQSLGVLTFSMTVLPPLWLKLGAAALIALSILAWNNWVWNKLITTHPIGIKYNDDFQLIKAKKATVLAAFVPYLIILALSLAL